LISLGVLPLTLSSVDTAPYGVGLPPSSSALGRLRNRTLNILVQQVILRAMRQAADQLLAGLPTPGQDVSMRYVELRRHTDNDGDKLSEQGVAETEAIGRTGLNPPYAAFISTGAERATEMLRILRRAADQDQIPITTETGMRSSVEDRWREAAKVAGRGASIEEMRAVDPDLVEHETQLLGSALQRVVEGLPEGGRALVVGHSPTNEAAVSGLVGETIAALGKGEGVLVVEDRGRYEVRPL
jgi:hypothetical protein